MKLENIRKKTQIGEDKSSSINRIIFTVLGNVLIISKFGLNTGGDGGVTLPALLEFPKVDGVASVSILPLTILKLFQVNSLPELALFHLILTLAFSSLVFWKISCQHSSVRLLLLAAVIGAPVTIELLNLVGIFDLFTIIGWYLYLISKNNWSLVFGILFISLSDPPQVPFSCLLLYLFSVGNPTLIDKSKLIKLSFFSITSYMLIELWLSLNNASGFLNQNGGYELFGTDTKSFLLNSTFEFVRNMPNSLISIYGLFWIPVLLFVINLKREQIIWSLSSLILIPVFLAVIFIDSTRVATNIAFPIVVVASFNYFKSISEYQLRSQGLVWFLLALFYPVNYYYAGIFINPFAGYLSLIQIIFNVDSNCITDVFTPTQQEICKNLKNLIW